MSSAAINDLLVVRLNTVSGETSASATLPRECTLVQVYTQGGTVAQLGDIEIYRVRTGQADVLVADSAFGQAAGAQLETENLTFLNVLNADETLFLTGDSVKIVKDNNLSSGIVFFLFQAPGATLMTASA